MLLVDREFCELRTQAFLMLFLSGSILIEGSLEKRGGTGRPDFLRTERCLEREMGHLKRRRN